MNRLLLFIKRVMWKRSILPEKQSTKRRKLGALSLISATIAAASLVSIPPVAAFEPSEEGTSQDQPAAEDMSVDQPAEQDSASDQGEQADPAAGDMSVDQELTFPPEKPAAAAGGYNDSFHVNVGRSGRCKEDPNNSVGGVISFIDYGPGAPGGGNNDDYVQLWDTCSNKHGVKGWAWLNGELLGEKYNGKGHDKRVIWDPFKRKGNVKAGDNIGLKICEVDGNGDPHPGPCNWGTVTSVDG